MAYDKLQVRLVPCFVITIYTDLLCEQGDEVTVETKRGTALGVVTKVEPSKYENPFAEGVAKRHVLENLTKGLKKEEVIMKKDAVVEVRHISSERCTIVHTNVLLCRGDIVVYERENLPLCDGRAPWSVGIVVNPAPRATSAQSWVVCKVDIAEYVKRVERAEQLNDVKRQLDDKKKQYQDIELLRLIAANDPETKELLSQYLTLIGGEV